MTPIDVLKTRIATGTCPTDMSSCVVHVIKETGFGSLYAGAGSRMLLSGAFSAIGFGVFEASKKWLRVSDDVTMKEAATKEPVFSSPQRLLDHACTDALVESVDTSNNCPEQDTRERRIQKIW